MLRSFARVVALVAAFPLTSLAQDKADQLAADDSVAVSSRNAIINFGQVWIQDANVTLPVNFCKRTIKQVETEDGETKEESNTKCYDSTEWRAEMTESWVQRQAALLGGLGLLAHQRGQARSARRGRRGVARDDVPVADDALRAGQQRICVRT